VPDASRAVTGPAGPRYPTNQQVATRLDEVASLLHQQGANPFRAEAYRRAADRVRSLALPVEELLEKEGDEGLEALGGIGPGLARAIHELVRTGRLAVLDRLRGEADPITALTSVPGIGQATADKLVHEYGIGTLEDLEVAAHDGRLAKVRGFGEKRIAAIRDTLAARLGRLRRPVEGSSAAAPSVAELLDVDAEYREKAAAGRLTRIAPRRFNPTRTAWLPLLHTTRGDRHYTVAFSNTPRAHRLGRTHDWVVVYCDGARGERQYTIVSADTSLLRGRRVVRGRERECDEYYLERARAAEKLRDAGETPEQLELVGA
jgi:predicted flap endonuclease-1-like 5' DNA nuclease